MFPNGPSPLIPLTLDPSDLLSLLPCRPKAALVYNCTTGGINPFHWGEIGRYLSVCLYACYSDIISACSSATMSSVVINQCTSAVEILIKSHFIGHIHMVNRCYCECCELLVLLVPTVQLYLTIPQQLPNTHKSK